MSPAERQKAIREAILHYARITGSVNNLALIPSGYAQAEVEAVLQELYRSHDLERITKDGQRTYFIPEWPR